MSDADLRATIKDILEHVSIEHHGADYGCPYIEGLDEVVDEILIAIAAARPLPEIPNDQ